MTPSQVQFLGWLSVPVAVQRQVPWLERAENCGVPQLPCLWPLSSFWTRLLCPSVQRLCSRNAWFDYGYILCIFTVAIGSICTIFYMKG